MKRAAEDSAKLRRWERGLLLAALVLVACYLLFFLHASLRRALYPFQHLYGEAIILNQVRLLQAGEPLYQDIERLPYINTCYTPLYQACLALVSPARPSFLPGRVLTLLAALGVSLLIFLNLRRDALPLVPALTLACYFLLAHPTPTWASVCRVDMLALLLMMLSLGILARCTHRAGVISAGLAAALCLLVKQSYGLGLVALFAFAWRHRRRQLAAFCLACGLPLLATTAYLEYASGGEFLKHTVAYNLHPFHPRQLDHFALLFLRHYWLLIAACLLYFLRPRTPSPFAYYLPAALVVVAGTGKSGAAENYFLEFLAVSLVLGGKVLASLLATGGKRSRLVALSLLLFAIPPGAMRPFPHLPNEAEYAAKTETFEVFKGINGPVLARDYEFVVLSGKPLLYEPHQMANLYHKGVFRATGLLEDIRAGHFAMVQLYPFVQEEFFPWDFRHAVKQHYRLGFSLHGREYYFVTR